MRAIADWATKNLRCHFCGETRSAKYAMEVLDPVVSNKPTEVCVCNKCAAIQLVLTTKPAVSTEVK